MPSKELIEKVARVICFETGSMGDPMPIEMQRVDRDWQEHVTAAKAAIFAILAALQEPTEGMTGNVRHIMMWLGEARPTEKSLMEMCERRGVEPPNGCGVFDHVPSKAAQAYWIWQEMLAAWGAE